MEGEKQGPNYGALGEESVSAQTAGTMNGGPRSSEPAGAVDEGGGEATAIGGSEDVGRSAAHGRDVITTPAVTQSEQRETTGLQFSQPVMVQQGANQTAPDPSVEHLQPPSVSQGPMASSHVVEQMQQHVVVGSYEFSPPEELPERDPGRTSQPGGQAMWLVKLGEFVQKRVSQAGAMVSPLLEQRARGPTSTPRLSPPTSWTGQPTTPPRLFTPSAERQMQQWAQRAPLLHGLVPLSRREWIIDRFFDTRADSFGGAEAC